MVGPWSSGLRVWYSKAGLDKFANAVAQEFKMNNVAIINIDLGLIITERVKLFSPGSDDNCSTANTPDITAKAVAFICRGPMKYTSQIIITRDLYNAMDLGRSEGKATTHTNQGRD